MRDCQCGLETGSSDPQVTAEQTQELVDYAGHTDWRLREWAGDHHGCGTVSLSSDQESGCRNDAVP